MRRESAAVAAVIVVVLGVLAPLTLGGGSRRRPTWSAFYAPFASFLHDRLAAGDLPFWAPGAFSGQPFLADAQSGVTYPPMLLAAWLLGPIDALRSVATFHYLIAALGAYALARQLGAQRTGSAFGAIAFAASGHLVARSAALGLLGGAAWLAPALALAEAAASARPARRGFAIAGLAVVLAFDLASGSQQLAALTLASCAIWLVARAGARGALVRRRSRSPLALALAAVALLPRLELLRLATASGYVDPDGVGSLLFGDRRALVGRFGVSHSEIATLYLGAATLALAVIGAQRGRRDGAPVRLLLGLIALSLAWATGLVGWVMDPLPLVRTVAGHEPVRGIVLALLCACVLAAFALPEARRWPCGLAGRRARAADRRPGGRQRWARAQLPHPARRPSAPCSPCAASGSRRCCCSRCWAATWPGRRRTRISRCAGCGRRRSPRSPRAAPRSCSRASAARARSASRPRRPSPCSCTSSGAHRSASARALLLDQEALRLGLEDVAGYNPVHLKRYNRLMLASNGGRAVDRHFELALRPATPQLRSLAVRYYVSPPGDAPAGLPVVYRDRLSVVTRDDAALPFARIVRPGRAPLAARVVDARARPHRDRPARPRPPGRGRSRLPGLEGQHRREAAPAHWRPATCARSRCRPARAA